MSRLMRKQTQGQSTETMFWMDNFKKMEYRAALFCHVLILDFKL